jgi:hypothetical protein
MKTKTNPTETCESIKLGIDAHAKWYFVAPPQSRPDRRPPKTLEKGNSNQ